MAKPPHQRSSNASDPGTQLDGAAKQNNIGMPADITLWRTAVGQLPWKRAVYQVLRQERWVDRDFVRIDHHQQAEVRTSPQCSALNLDTIVSHLSVVVCDFSYCE